MVNHAIKIMALGGDECWRDLGAIDPARDIDPVQDGAAWYILADPDAILHPNFVDLLRIHGADRPDVDIFYGDEVIAPVFDRPWQYLCKPTFDQTQLLAQDYIGLPLAVRHRAMVALSGLDASARSARCFDLLLRAILAGIKIERITEVLAINPANGFRASVGDRLAALRGFMPQHHPACEVVAGLTETTLEARRHFDDYPEVTLIIPTCQTRMLDHPMILALLDGICRTDWPMDRLRVLIGDDEADGTIYQTRAWPFRLERRVTTRAPEESFNYARKINSLWRAALTEHLIILNDDLLVREPNWMRALMTFAMDESVGGVGGRLLYPNNTVQHAGMPAGVMGPCTHAFIGTPAARPTYQNWAVVQREWSMVTGALFATRRSILSQVNGFDERFSLNYNDVDLCLRLRSLGYRIVYTPHAELTHVESASRGKERSPADQTALFMEKWQDYLEDDPSYHPKLTRSTPDIRPVLSNQDWWASLIAPNG